jgi:hypothetical protein
MKKDCCRKNRDANRNFCEKQSIYGISVAKWIMQEVMTIIRELSSNSRMLSMTFGLKYLWKFNFVLGGNTLPVYILWKEEQRRIDLEWKCCDYLDLSSLDDFFEFTAELLMYLIDLFLLSFPWWILKYKEASHFSGNCSYCELSHIIGSKVSIFWLKKMMISWSKLIIIDIC